MFYSVSISQEVIPRKDSTMRNAQQQFFNKKFILHRTTWNITRSWGINDSITLGYAFIYFLGKTMFAAFVMIIVVIELVVLAVCSELYDGILKTINLFSNILVMVLVGWWWVALSRRQPELLTAQPCQRWWPSITRQEDAREKRYEGGEKRERICSLRTPTRLQTQFTQDCRS